MATYVKLTKENRPDNMQFEYGLLEEHLAHSIRKPDGPDVGYYEGKRSEISLSWLNGGGDVDGGNGASVEQNYVWHANMSISLWQCRDIFDAAQKGLPKKSVEALVFADYEMDSNEELLFETCYMYGQAYGLNEVCGELFEGARAGDPRAVKMYLEVSGLLLKNAEDLEDINRKKLMRIKLDV